MLCRDGKSVWKKEANASDGTGPGDFGEWLTLAS